jgi:ABC-2 type transport system permease protein
MKDLLYKEFKLGWHPALYLFFLFGAFLLIPSWPFFIAFGYLFIAINSKFFLDRGNQDVFFTALLPTRKRNVVLAKIYFIAVIELLQVIVAVPFAFIRNTVYHEGNMAGMNTNFAFFGFVLIMYAIFNIIFLPGFFKTAYKIGTPMVLAILSVAVYVMAVEVAMAKIPILHATLNGLGTSDIAYQLPILFAGIVLFVLLTILAYRISANYFEKVEL